MRPLLLQDREPFTKESIDILLSNIMEFASKLEKDGEIMDNVAAIIRKGIKEAERELKVEADLGVSHIEKKFIGFLSTNIYLSDLSALD
jgi:hypothetical protein